MRPVSLSMEGFAAFRERIDIEFGDAPFFALVGPTGAGKSSVIDAICFALYGSIPRLNNKKLVAPAVTTGVLQARVALTFEVDGKRYIAVRVVRRIDANRATTREATLEEVPPDGPTIPLAGDADALTAAVEKLLGLSFDHFTRCVVLPQGEFARFLHDKPSARQDLLVTLLGLGLYQRLMQRAGILGRGLRGEVTLAEQELGKRAWATDAARGQARNRHAALVELRAMIRAAAPELAALERCREEATATARAARADLARLAQVKVPAEILTLSESRARAERARADADDRERAARAPLEELARRRAALPDPGALAEAIRDHAQLAELDRALGRSAAALELADAALAKARRAEEGAESAARQALVERDAVRRAHAAHEVAAALAVGEPCPACGQQVAKLPRRKRPAGLEALERALNAADRSVEMARRSANDAAVKQAESRKQHELIETQRAAIRARLAGKPQLAELEAERTAVREIDAAMAQTHSAAQLAARDRDAARKTVAAIEARVSSAGADFHAQRDPISHLGPPPPEGRDLGADWQALAAWAQERAPACERDAQGAEGDSASHARERDARLGSLAEACVRLEVVPPRGVAPSLDGLERAATDAVDAAARDLGRVEEALAEAKKLRRQAKEKGAEAGVAEQVAQLLKANNFETWLVSEAMTQLVAGASTILGQLSAGQYSLRSRGTDISVLDHRQADEERSVRTLSGGETFQASLALALALSDQIAHLSVGGAARFESIFLDEGFGALDPDSLEVVANTIETLGSAERMVGIVTHVPLLAARVPVRFEVARGPRTSTVRRVIA